MEERDFFDERTEKKMSTLNCPHCHQPAEYEVTWIVRTKKRQLTGRGDERDRARFQKSQSYMVLLDDKAAFRNVHHQGRVVEIGASAPLNERQDSLEHLAAEPHDMRASTQWDPVEVDRSQRLAHGLAA